MINLRKQDPIADAVKDILQQEALKGNQTKIDKNHNGKIDGQDFKILRGEKKAVKEEETVDEGVKEVAKKAFKALTGGSDKDQLNALRKRMYKPEPAKKPSDKAMGEEVEQLEEGGIGDLPNRGMGGSDTDGPHGVYHSSGNKLKIVSKHKTLDSALKHVDKLRKKSGKADHFYGHLSLHGPDQGKIPSQFHEEVEIEEGLQQTLRKYVPGYAKRQIDKKMDAEKFGRRDVDKDANFYRYKKVQDKLKKEEVESLDEGKMDKMTLSGLWHKHAQHSYWNDQGYGSGTDSPRHSGHAATAIENHVRKHHGNKVADDMVSHSDHHVAYHEYAGPEESPHHEKEMAKLKKKHGISDKDLHESAPPGFEGTVKAMKKHKDIDNPWALAWSMKNKGYKSHKKADGSAKNEEVEQIDELSKSTLGSYVKGAARDVGVSRKLSADFQNNADKSRNASTKTANSSISKKFNDIAKKRQSGIGKAVERLTKEEVMPKTLKQFKENAFDWKKKPEPQPNGGSGVKQGSRYGGSKQKDVPEKDTDEKK